MLRVQEITLIVVTRHVVVKKGERPACARLEYFSDVHHPISTVHSH